MGLPSAVLVFLAQCAIGLWTQCLFNDLYLRYMKLNPRGININRSSRVKQVTQPHEVIGGLLGHRWRLIFLVSHLCTVFYFSFIQLLACTNAIYFLNDSMDKRTWVCVFGAIFSLSILIPTAQNYRVWSFIGVISTIFVSLYLTVASILHEKDMHVRHSSPRNYMEYFKGLSGLIFVGSIPVPVETMDAMYKPQQYKVACAYSMLYIFLACMLPCVTMYIVFGDELLTTTNAFSKFSSSIYRNVSIVLLVFDAYIAFGMYSLALYAVWEKLLRVHSSRSYVKRTLSRVPVFLALFFAALAFPFFGVVNKLLDSAISTWSLYILPCVAYNVVIWAGDHEKSLTRLGWVADFSVNLGIIIWVLIVECGLGTWANVDVIVKLNFKLFERCYNCNNS